MKYARLAFIILLTVYCGEPDTKVQSAMLINEAKQQNAIFRSLEEITNNSIPAALRNDSLAFLILPVQASCPSCRDKTIDSIVAYQKSLQDGHFIVISAGGGRKTISGYFLEQDQELPIMKDQLYLDSTNRAFQLDLVKDRPTIYYACNRKVYKKVASIPATIREDLREFFSGY